MERIKILSEKERQKYDLPLGNVWKEDRLIVPTFYDEKEFRNVSETSEITGNLIRVLQDEYIKPDWIFDRLFASSSDFRAIFIHPESKEVRKSTQYPVDFIKPEMIFQSQYPGSVLLDANDLNDVLKDANLISDEPSAHYGSFVRKERKRFPVPHKNIEFFSQSGVAVISSVLIPMEGKIEELLEDIGDLRREYQRNIEPYRMELQQLNRAKVANPKPFP